MTDTGACGTYAGFQRHRRIPEEPCDDCRTAARDYIRHYRQNHPAAMVRHHEVTRARFRALTTLSHLHPDEYRALYTAELARARGKDVPQ